MTGHRTEPDLAGIGDLAVPAGGEWRLRVSLRDAAGNVDPDGSGLVEPLRFDPDVPEISFLPFDPLDPARVRVQAADVTSGVAAVEVDARIKGGVGVAFAAG